MKKLFTLVLAAVMVFSLSVTAFADQTTDTETVTITKSIDSTGLEAETFDFTVTEDGMTDTAASVTAQPEIDDFSITIAKGATEGSYTITLPEYTSVGIYTYTISEAQGSTAGVGYTASDLTLIVTVTNGTQGGFIRTVALKTADGTKINEVGNTYQAGSLAVTKAVTGNLGDKTKEFTVTVTFSSQEQVNSVIAYDGGEITVSDWEEGTVSVQITMKDGSTVTFQNIPYGVTYTVEEDDYSEDGYTTSYENEQGTISAESVTCAITNDKTTEVDTGIHLDTLPYVMMLAVAVLGLAVLMGKRRSFE